MGNAFAKFNETVEISARLGVDPRKADQMVRETVQLRMAPKRSVCVFAKGRQGKRSQRSGCGICGEADDLLEKIKEDGLSLIAQWRRRI